MLFRSAVIEIYLDSSLKRIQASTLNSSSLKPDNYTKYGPNQNYLVASKVGAAIDMKCHTSDEITNQVSTGFVYKCSMYYRDSDGVKKFVVGVDKLQATPLTYTKPDGITVINPLDVWLNGDPAQLKKYSMTAADPKSIGTRQYGDAGFLLDINIYEIIFDITL